MSKKNMESTRELMGTREVTDYSIRTRMRSWFTF